MKQLTAELLQQLKSAEQEEIMCREASDTSDAWQDLASPENVLALLEIVLPVLEQQEKLLSLMPPSYCIKCDNTGQMDSGGTQPWGDAIMVTCDCQAKPSTNPQIDNDGWIELVDAEMPVHPDSVVEVKMRNGATDGPREAARFFWYRGNEVRDEMGCDIIAYRVIENDGREG